MPEMDFVPIISFVVFLLGLGLVWWRKWAKDEIESVILSIVGIIAIIGLGAFNAFLIRTHEAFGFITPVWGILTAFFLAIGVYGIFSWIGHKSNIKIRKKRRR